MSQQRVGAQESVILKAVIWNVVVGIKGPGVRLYAKTDMLPCFNCTGTNLYCEWDQDYISDCSD